MWKIIDDNNTLYSGSEDEMREQFDNMKYTDEWDGDLLLIEIHDIAR